MDVQLPIIEEEFALENWRAEGRADAEEWSALSAYSRKHAKERSNVQWKVAAWLLRGKENGLSNAQLEAEVALIYREMPRSTIWDYIRVAKRFRDHSRRRESLYFSHHKEVAIDEFNDALQDQLLNEAERRTLSVPKLRDVAKSWKKREGEKERAGRGRGVKKVAVFLSTDRFKLLKKLAYARGYIVYRNHEDLVADMVGKYFNDNSEMIAKEVKEWEERVSKGRHEAKETFKQKKLQREVLLAPRRPAWEYVKELQVKTGQNTASLLVKYVKKECGHAKFEDVPVEILDRLLTTLKGAGEPEAQVALLKAMSEPRSPIGKS
jgi:hypothetical protein